MSLLRENLRRLMVEKGFNQKSLSLAAGKNETAVRDILERARNPRQDTLSALAKVLEVSVSELVGDEALPEMDPSPHRKRLADATDRLSTAVPEVDVRGGMGGGGVYAVEYNDTDENGNTTAVDNVKAIWTFPTAYIRDELRSQTAKAWLMEVKGDSMKPTLESGDRVMVDTSDTLPSPGGVFAIFDGLSVVVKRLHYITNSDPAQIRVISDNPNEGEETHPLDEIKVIGRVVWFGRKL